VVGIVAEVNGIVLAAGRDQADEHRNRRGAFANGHAKLAHHVRQPRQREVDPVLHQDLRHVWVGADLEGDRQAHRAVARALGPHVEHILNPVDLLLDRGRDRVGHGLGVGARVAGHDKDSRRRDFRILRHGQRQQPDASQQHGEDGEHGREDRPANEKMGELHEVN